MKPDKEVIDFWTKMASDQLCDPDGDSRATFAVVQVFVREIARLTEALHKVKAHPNFSYITVPAGGMPAACSPGGWTTPTGTTALVAGEWERCSEAEVEGSPDEVWRRRREP